MRDANDNHLIVGIFIITHMVLMENGAKTARKSILGYADSGMVEKMKDAVVKGIDEGVGSRLVIQRNKGPDFR